MVRPAEGRVDHGVCRRACGEPCPPASTEVRMFGSVGSAQGICGRSLCSESLLQGELVIAVTVRWKCIPLATHLLL